MQQVKLSILHIHNFSLSLLVMKIPYSEYINHGAKFWPISRLLAIGHLWADWAIKFYAKFWAFSSTKMVFSLPLTLLVLEIFKVKVGTFFPIWAYISWRDVNYKGFWWEFCIFDHSHQFLGPKTPHLDTKNFKKQPENTKVNHR